MQSDQAQKYTSLQIEHLQPSTGLQPKFGGDFFTLEVQLAKTHKHKHLYAMGWAWGLAGQGTARDARQEYRTLKASMAQSRLKTKCGEALTQKLINEWYTWKMISTENDNNSTLSLIQVAQMVRIMQHQRMLRWDEDLSKKTHTHKNMPFCVCKGARDSESP